MCGGSAISPSSPCHRPYQPRRFVAAGWLGSAQRRELATTSSTGSGAKGLFRVVLIHHPPLPGQTELAARLAGCQEVQEILRDHGAELVLHGHNHEQSVLDCETVSGPAIVVGVPSASEAVDGRAPAARYNEYAIERAGNGWRVEMTGRAATKDARSGNASGACLGRAEPNRGEQPNRACQQSDDEAQDHHSAY